MDKETRWLIDEQIKCIKVYKGMKEKKINDILKKNKNLDIYHKLINYEIDLIRDENESLMANRLPGYEKEFEQIEKEFEQIEKENKDQQK